MRDIEEFFDPTLRLPIRGKSYAVPSPDAKTGLRVQRLLTTATLAAAGQSVSQKDMDALELDDDEERDLYLRLLGTAYDEMVEDGLPWAIVKHAGVTAFMWVAYDRDTAERYWESAAEPQGEAERPVPQDRKAPAAKKKSARQGSRGGSTAPRKQTATSRSRASS